ncbi:diacylglycerol/lipid kinase family protein [Halopiger thermotolerans]
MGSDPEGSRDDGDGDGGGTGDRVLVLNPVSGGGDHVDDVVELATGRGFEIRKTEEAGDAKRLARDAAADASLVAAAGGDGTVNGVANGIAAAGELETTTLGVVPVGTGNNFAANIGIEGLEHSFAVIDEGRRRRIDLGVADERAFVNSCVGGVTAEASGETSSESKAELGVLAYVKETLDAIGSFDALPLRVQTAEGPNGEAARMWEGNALFVLVGNCRRFTGARTAQADVEDGLFEVTIVADAPATELLSGAALEALGLFDRDSDNIVRRRTPSLTIESRDDAVGYSLDGEMLETERLDLETDASALEVAVGDAYRSNPDDGGRWPFRA